MSQIPSNDRSKWSNVQHVMHIFNGLNPSGMERMLLSAARHSPIPNDQITIVGQGKSNPFADQLRSAGYSVSIVPSISSMSGFKALVQLIKSRGPSVIHIHSEGTFAQAVLAARVASPSTPLVRSVHSIFKKKKFAAIYRRVVSFLLDRAVSRFVACSPEVRDFEEAFGRPTDLVWNWVDDKFFELRHNDSLSTSGKRPFLLVGNCSWIKNHDLAFTALNQASAGDSFDFSVAHYGLEQGSTIEERAKLDEWADQGKLTHRGPGDPSEGMRGCPTFLMPSLHEGMGVALAEAIVVGLPAIVSDVPGLQWAREFTNVRHVELNAAAWAYELVHFRPPKETDNEDISRFSAHFGINSFFEIYSSVIDQARPKTRPRGHKPLSPKRLR